MKLRLYKIAPFLLQATLWRIVMRPFFSFFTRFEVQGLENLKGLPAGVIFAPNHSSELDSVLLPLALPFWSRFSPMFYIVREPSFYSDPVFSWRRHLYSILPFKALGAYAIVSGVKDYAVTLKKHVALLDDGASVCIFPEGGFTKDGAIGRAHGGVGYMAYASQKPVVPVLIEGTAKNSSARGDVTRISVTFLPAQTFKATKAPDIADFQEFGNSVLHEIRSTQAHQAAHTKQDIEMVRPFGKDA